MTAGGCGPYPNMSTNVTLQGSIGWSGNDSIEVYDFSGSAYFKTKVLRSSNGALFTFKATHSDDWSFNLSVDTSTHEITTFSVAKNYPNINGSEESTYQEGADWTYSSNTYGKRTAFGSNAYVYWQYQYWGGNCGLTVHSRGVSFAGGQPSAAVIRERFILSPCILRFQSGTTLTFNSRSNVAEIRIFDLLGRECDRVAIPAGAESVEYNTSRLAPGMYIAQLGQQAVKFVVR